MLKLPVEKLSPYAPTLLRITVGTVFLAHGLQKLQEYASTIGFMAFAKIPLLPVSAWGIILLETVGGLLMILGLGTRWLSILFALEMTLTTLFVKLPLSIGFISAPGAPTAGFELDLLILGASISLFMLGSGAFSVEQYLFRRAGVEKSAKAT